MSLLSIQVVLIVLLYSLLLVIISFLFFIFIETPSIKRFIIHAHSLSKARLTPLTGSINDMIIIDQANQDRKQPNLSEILQKDELDDIDCNTLFENGI